jgi:hypothetical protein
VETRVSDALCRVYSCMPLQPNVWYRPQSRCEAGDTSGVYDVGCVVTVVYPAKARKFLSEKSCNLFIELALGSNTVGVTAANVAISDHSNPAG